MGIPHDIATEQPSASLELSGTWEQPGRTVNAAAVAGLVGIGAIYMYGQSALAFVALLSQGGLEFVQEGETNIFVHLARRAELTKNPIRIAVFVSQFVFMLLPTLWIIKHWHTPDARRYIRLAPSSVLSILLAALAALFWFPTNAYVSGLLVSLLNIPRELIEINQSILVASDMRELLFLVAVVCVTPALCEEIFFRGYVQRTFERSMGWKSVILVGVLFGLYHLQPLGLVSLSGLGVLFGYLYYGSKSLLPGMVAHFTNNLLALLVLYRGQPIEGNPLAALEEVPLELVLYTLPLAGVTLVLFHKLVQRKIPAAKPISPESPLGIL